MTRRDKVFLLGLGSKPRAHDLFLIWIVWSSVLGGVLLAATVKWAGLQAAVGVIYAGSIFVLRLMEKHIGGVAIYTDQISKSIEELSCIPLQLERKRSLIISDVAIYNHVSKFFTAKTYLSEASTLLANLKSSIVVNLVTAGFSALTSIVAAIITQKNSGSPFDLDWTTVLSAVLFTVSACSIWIPIQSMARRHGGFVV